MMWQLHCQFFCFFYAINKAANVFWVKSVRIFILSWPERLKRPSDFRIFLTIFRRLLNFAEDVWGCSDYLWALLKLFKRRHFFCVVILFVHKVNIKHFFGTLSGKLNWIVLINHILKNNSLKLVSLVWEIVLDAWDRCLQPAGLRLTHNG